MSVGVKILDCTLRDGGYVNDWNFGIDNIKLILNELKLSGVEYVECGYLSEKDNCSSDRTVFPSLEKVNSLALDSKGGCLACMINYGSFDFNHLPYYNSFGVDTIRVAFHKCDMYSAIRDCQTIKEKGYKIFLQPMATSTYSEDELSELFSLSNNLMPTAVYIVDSFGTMMVSDTLHILHRYNESLNSSISIGFHSHNNLQLSFTNSLEVIKLSHNREILIDSSVFGMGRGAGNLCTELILRYLNQTMGKSYNLIPILEIIDSCLNSIFIRTPWGYSVPYYIASINGCHPNYATYLVNKQTLGVSQINVILSRLPENERNTFDKSLIEQLYFEYQSYSIDDTSVKNELKKLLASRPLLVLAPGKSLSTHRNIINEFIDTQSPTIIALNFIPETFKADYLFLSNLKRFDSLPSFEGTRVIATSNIPGHPSFLNVDYTSLIKYGQPESDNAGLMFMRLLKSIDVRNFSLAGFDGFSEDIHDNYYDEKLINNTVTEIFSERNHNVKIQFAEIRKQMNVNVITPSRYV